MKYAACAGLATRQHDPWSPPLSAFFPPKEAAEICEMCPVRVACLAQAFEIHDDYTVRGGLTWRQRNAIKRPHLRHTCPSCGAFTEVSMTIVNAQVCIACGLSWLITRVEKKECVSVESSTTLVLEPSPSLPMVPSTVVLT
jgi:hypothetical protein